MSKNDKLFNQSASKCGYCGGTPNVEPQRRPNRKDTLAYLKKNKLNAQNKL